MLAEQLWFVADIGGGGQDRKEDQQPNSLPFRSSFSRTLTLVLFLLPDPSSFLFLEKITLSSSKSGVKVTENCVTAQESHAYHHSSLKTVPAEVHFRPNQQNHSLGS